MVLPALFIVVPGDTLSAAAGELLGGHLTAGTIRLVYGFLTLGLIVVGIVAATGVTGHGEALVETLPPPELPFGVVLTVGGVGVRGATSLLGGDILTGLQNLSDFALQVATVALGLAAGVILSDHWLRHTRPDVT